MIERRGPDYVRPEIWQAVQAKRQRRVRITMVPVVLAVLGVTVASLLMPARIAQGQLDKMMAAARAEPSFHAIERRAGEQAGILREEYVHQDSRRILMFDGEVELLMGGHGVALASERMPSVRRRHMGSITTLDTVDRLLLDCERPWTVRVVEEGRLEVTTRDKKFEITQDSRGRPIAWQTSYRNEIGFHPLWETTVEYGPVSPANFDHTINAVSLVDHVDPNAAVFTQETVLHEIGDVALTAINVNRLGDLIFVSLGRYERPYVEVVNAQGQRLSPHTLQSTLWRDRRLYRSEVMAIRLQTEPVQWPVEYTVRIRNYDPRFKVQGFPNRVVGEKTFRFEKPTCVSAPPYWFGRVMSDQPYFDYLSQRAYRLATVFQNAMRTKDGHLVDTMTGGAVGRSEADLIKSPIDTARAIDELRQVLRLKAEFDNNTLPLSQLYVQLAALYVAAGYKEQAKSALQFVQSRTRYARVDASILAEMERLTKELEE